MASGDDRKEERKPSVARIAFRTTLATVVLGGLWLVAREAWLVRSPVALHVFLAAVWPLCAAAFLTRLPRAAGGLLVLLGLLVVEGLSRVWLDRLAPPLDTTWPWEAARLALIAPAAYLLAPALRHRRARVWVEIVRALAVAPVAAAATLMILAGHQGSRDETRRADAALVLGLALEADGSPQPSLVARVDRAAALYRARVVRRVVVSGGVPRAGLREADVMRALLRRRAVPDEAIVVEPYARSTEENFACAAPILESLGARDVLLVTEPWHMTRAMLLGRRYGLTLRQAPAKSDAWQAPAERTRRLFRESIAWVFEQVRAVTRRPSRCVEVTPRASAAPAGVEEPPA